MRTPLWECFLRILQLCRIIISILTPLRECFTTVCNIPHILVSILTPLRKCFWCLIHTGHCIYFNTHSLAGVYRDCLHWRFDFRFQYSLPCGSAFRDLLINLQHYISILTPSRECIRLALKAIAAELFQYSLPCGSASWVSITFCSSDFNTHSLAGVHRQKSDYGWLH